MNGSVAVESTVGQGSTFTVRVTLARAHEKAATLVDSQPLPAGGSASLLCLVVEDNLVNQKVAVGYLTKLGHKARCVGNGREALAILAIETFDVVLMDCHMPEMDGYEATARIRGGAVAHAAHIPIIAMTANASKSEREKCLDVGMTDYLTKPLRLAELSQTIEASVGRKPKAA
jgi:CheY-like chemotaxis protein